MILVDTGPFVALFDPKDEAHKRCVMLLRDLNEPLVTTIPILTETFHMLGPDSIGSNNLRDFAARGVSMWFFDPNTLSRAFELMEQYADQPMDLADASLVVAAETLGTRRVFTVDRRDFAVYRVKRGHRYYPFDVLS